MEIFKQKFLETHFLKNDQQQFLNDAHVWLIEKMQASDPTKTDFCWMRILKILYPDSLNTERDY